VADCSDRDVDRRHDGQRQHEFHGLSLTTVCIRFRCPQRSRASAPHRDIRVVDSHPPTARVPPRAPLLDQSGVSMPGYHPRHFRSHVERCLQQAWGCVALSPTSTKIMDSNDPGKIWWFLVGFG
jgi:hypothetical protein